MPDDLRDLDWYGDDLGAATYRGATFTAVDLSETMSKGATFEDCTFHNCRFNSSVHVASAFVACDFRRCSFFDAMLDGCKLTGSTFAECTLRPLSVRGGQWLGVSLRGANLSGLVLDEVDLREADLSMADLTATSLRDARLGGATLRETVLARADLRGATLGGVDLREARLEQTHLDLAGAVLLAELHGAEVDPSAGAGGRRAPVSEGRAATAGTSAPARVTTDRQRGGHASGWSPQALGFRVAGRAGQCGVLGAPGTSWTPPRAMSTAEGGRGARSTDAAHGG